MKKSGLIIIATLIFASFSAFAQQADEELDDFNIPGVEKSLDELVGPEPEVSFPDAAKGPVVKDAVPEKTEQQKAAPEPAPQSVVKVETPVEVPGVEWVRVVPDRHGLEEVSFEVPTNWKQKKGIWVVKKGENPETGLKVDMDKFKQEDLEKAAKAFPDSSAIKRTINGTEVDIISRKQTIKKIDFTIRIAAFGAPMFAGKERLIMMFSSDNIKRDAPIFEHIMQTVKSSHEPEKSVAEKEMALGATPLKLVKIEPGKAGELEGALKLLYNDGARDGTKYSVVMVDLDNDGIEEAIIHINQPYGYCNDNEGTCRIVVMKRDTSQKWDYVTFRNGFYAKSVSLLSSSSNGYRDLAFAGELYTFNGDSYQRGKSVDVKKISPAEAGSASAENAAKQTEKVVVPEDVGTKPVITLPKPATKTPNIEWVRVTSANKELKGISFDVPKNWPRIGDFDTWTKKTGSKIDVQLDMGFTRPKDLESTDAKAHLKKFIPRKSVINGIFVEILTAEIKHDGGLYNENLVFFGEPLSSSQGRITMMFDTSNIKRDGPIFQHILNSVRFAQLSTAKTPESKKYQFEKANYWYKSYKILNNFTSMQECARLCDEDDKCAVASFHDSTATGGYANMCALRGKAESRHTEQVGIYSWVKGRDLPGAKPAVPTKQEITPSQTAVAGQDKDLPNRAYFMRGDQYVRYNIAQDKSDPGYPKSIDATIWPGVWQDGIDAVANWGNGKIYFFKGGQYIRFDVATNRSDPGYPRTIDGSNWPGLWRTGVDAAVNWGNGKVYFFKGYQYIQFDIAANRSDPGYPRTIDGSNWPGLWGGGVDAALNFGNGKVYFFKQDQYVRFDIAANSPDSGYPRAISSTSWPGLWGGDINAATNWGAVVGSRVLKKSGEQATADINTVGEIAGVEFNTDRGGSDYRNFTLKQPDYRICQQTCTDEQQCKAWTYVKPGIQGSDARCWLKSSVPGKSINDCCTSGLKIPPATTEAVAPASPATAENWQIYSNPRFGTSIEYPASIFTAMPPPENGDGRKFESWDGRSSFMVFGSHNALDQSLKELYSEQLVSDQYQAILGKYLQKNRFTFRARSQKGLVLQTVILDNEGVIHTFQMRYKEADEDVLEPVMLRMLKSFSATAKPVATQPNRQSKNTGTAQDQAIELAFWQSISQSTDPADFEAYLSRWPNGSFAALANNSLRRLKQAAAPQASRQTAPVTKSIPVSRRKYHSPARGTSERKAIMNAARIPISKALGQKVIFVVSILRSDGRWAYLQAVPHRPNGRKLNWSRTPYASDWKNDAMSDVVMVLLRKDGRKWKAIDHVIGPTDVHWVSWLDQYGLPQSLFSAR